MTLTKFINLNKHMIANDYFSGLFRYIYLVTWCFSTQHVLKFKSDICYLNKKNYANNNDK